MIKPFITPELMAIEATKRGIAAGPEFKNKLIQNQNALLRFQVHGAIEARANEVLRGPELEAKLSAWYEAHAGAYAVPAKEGGKKIPPLSEVGDRVLADFSVALCEDFLAEKARTLRAQHVVVVDEAALAKL